MQKYVNLNFDDVLNVTFVNFDPFVYRLKGSSKVPAIKVNGWPAVLVPIYYDGTESKGEAEKRLNKEMKEYIKTYVKMFVDDKDPIDDFLSSMKRK